MTIVLGGNAAILEKIREKYLTRHHFAVTEEVENDSTDTAMAEKGNETEQRLKKEMKIGKI